MSYPFRNLVFEGGGVKGSAYIGAIRTLNEDWYRILIIRILFFISKIYKEKRQNWRKRTKRYFKCIFQNTTNNDNVR